MASATTTGSDRRAFNFATREIVVTAYRAAVPSAGNPTVQFSAALEAYRKANPLISAEIAARAVAYILSTEQGY